MPRKNQQNKKNKRHRKGSYSGWDSKDGNNDVHGMPATSLEDDLRQQRIRQQQRQRQREEAKEKEDEQGEDDSCKHDVGFDRSKRFQKDWGVASATRITNHLILKGAVLPASVAALGKDGRNDSSRNGVEDAISLIPPVSIRLPPSFMLRHIEQTSPFLALSKRNTLRKLWQTQHQLESLTVQPRAASMYSKTKWPQVMLEYDSNLHCSYDLSCKHRLHSSARTFDIAMLDNHRSTNAPTIATIVQDGVALLRKQSHYAINTMKVPPVYAVRMHESSSMLGMIVKPANSNRNRMSEYSFHWYPLPHATSYVEADLPGPVTDFCFGKELAVFACPRHPPHANESLNPLFLPLVEAGGSGNPNYYNSPVRSINVRNFPQSDALRIEMMCEGQEKLLGFGHRNGQVSILDLRASGTVCSILHCEETKTANWSLGSVSDLGFLSAKGRENQVLVKRSFGSCQLHDLRKSTSSLSSLSDHNSTTVVRHMTVPQHQIIPTLSANCNGFVIDPNGHQTLFSPYVDNESGDARLGVWSLETGLMVGSRLLQKKVNPSADIHVEVCSKTAPLMVPKQQQEQQLLGSGCKNDFSSSYGIWLKCGAAFTSDNLPSKVGSLHQLAIPGNWKCDWPEKN